jgi:membrane-associated phospholipid phosphatase
MTPSKLIQWWLAAIRSRRELIVACDLIAACVIVLFMDNWIAAFVSPLQRSFVVHLFAFVPDRVQLGVIFAVGMMSVIVYRKASGDNLRADRGMFILGCGVLAGFAADILKIVFGRPRPDDSLMDMPFSFHFFGGGESFDSFPSSHAAIAAGLAGAISIIWPAHRRIFFALAVTVAASRFITGAHYLSDALLGFAVGLGIVVVVQVLFGRCGFQLHS